ncbi:MAG: hypothetical protein D8M59_03370 [Planctomycetes bacterium]|nr:hypothetical protein [Planctomycetota bacterium]
MLAVATTSFGQEIDKQPDFGAWWHPLSNHGSYAYASDFVCPDGVTTVGQIGIWLRRESGGTGSVIALQIWGDAPGPDSNNIIASTDDFQISDDVLTLSVIDVTSQSSDLVPGDRYWVVATGALRGDPGYDSYQVGGHTQNSVYPDNGTFWYSNDANGINFDGQGLTPQMAFQIYGGGGMHLTVVGDCPGTNTLTCTGVTANAKCYFAYGLRAGSTNVPGCPGLTVDIAGGKLGGVSTADAGGEAVLRGNVPANACGRVIVQAVDRDACAVSNTVGI